MRYSFLTLINGKSSLSSNDVLTTLLNHKVRSKNNASSSSSTIAEALTAREIDFNHRKGKKDVGKSKNDNDKLRKNQCVFTRKKNIKRFIVQG